MTPEEYASRLSAVSASASRNERLNRVIGRVSGVACLGSAAFGAVEASARDLPMLLSSVALAGAFAVVYRVSHQTAELENQAFRRADEAVPGDHLD